ncbi:MAG: hypothetical protein ACRBN8_28515 [Nannocystales bacterium]
MLVECPECAHRVSDRAAACPQCGFPVAAEWEARREREAVEADRTSREEIGEVDCVACKARGFVTEGPEDRPGAFSWCAICQHSGRTPLVRSQRGFWSVAFGSLDAFVGGEDIEGPNAVFIGEHAPEGHRYEKAGPRAKPTSDE